MLLQVFKSFNPGILFAPISFRSDRLLHLPASKIVEYEPEQSLGLKAAFLAAIKDEEARRNVCYTLLGHGENLLEIMNHRFFKADVGKLLPKECYIAKEELAYLLRTPEWLESAPSEKVVLELLQHVEHMVKAVQQASYSANKITSRAIETKKVPREIIFKLYGLPRLDHVVDRFEAFHIHEAVYKTVSAAVSKSINGALVKELLVRGPVGWAELWVETSIQVVEAYEAQGSFGSGSVFKDQPGYPTTHEEARVVAIETLRKVNRRRMDSIAGLATRMDRYQARFALTPESLLDDLWRELLNVWGPGGTASPRDNVCSPWGSRSNSRDRSSSDPRPRRDSVIDRGRDFVRRMSGGPADSMQSVSTYSSATHPSAVTLPTILAPDVPMTASFSSGATATVTPTAAQTLKEIDFSKRPPPKWMEHADPAVRARAYHAWRSRATQHISANVPAGYLPSTAELTLAGYSPAAVEMLWNTGELPAEDQDPAKWELAYEISKDLRPRKDDEYHVHNTTGVGLVILPENRVVDNFDVRDRLDKATAKLWVVKRRRERGGVRFEDDYVSSSEEDRAPSPGEWERRGKGQAIDALNRLRAGLDRRRRDQPPSPPHRPIPGPPRSPFMGIAPPPPTRANSVKRTSTVQVHSRGQVPSTPERLPVTTIAEPSPQETAMGNKQAPPPSPRRNSRFSTNAEAGPSRLRTGTPDTSSTTTVTRSPRRSRATKASPPAKSSNYNAKNSPKGKGKAPAHPKPQLRRNTAYSPPEMPPKVRISQTAVTNHRGLEVPTTPSGTAVEAVRRRTGDLFMGSGLPQGEEQAGTWQMLNNPIPSWRDIPNAPARAERLVQRTRDKSLPRVPTQTEVDEFLAIIRELDETARLHYRLIRGDPVSTPIARKASPHKRRRRTTRLQPDQHQPPEDTMDTAADTDDEFFECETFDEGQYA